MLSKEIMLLFRDIAKRTVDIRDARSAFPGMEIGEAYTALLSERGEVARALDSRYNVITRDMSQRVWMELRFRPCSVAGCGGEQMLDVA